MNPTIEATEADHIPTDARVCHYDELTGDAKHALPEAVANGTAEVPWRAAEQFATIDVVKFTAYYRVSLPAFEETTEDAATRADTRSDGRSDTRSDTRSGRPSRARSGADSTRHPADAPSGPLTE